MVLPVSQKATHVSSWSLRVTEILTDASLAPADPKSPMTPLAIAIACSSSRARWSVTPLSLECIWPPPSVSSSTSSPVAAFTSGGPARNIRPCSRTMIFSSAIAGTYAPPLISLIGKRFQYRQAQLYLRRIYHARWLLEVCPMLTFEPAPTSNICIKMIRRKQYHIIKYPPEMLFIREHLQRFNMSKEHITKSRLLTLAWCGNAAPPDSTTSGSTA
jgi:hypothetical protein